MNADLPDTPEILRPTVVPVRLRAPGPAPLAGVPVGVTGVAVKVTGIQVKDTRPGVFGSARADVYPIFLAVLGPSSDPVAFATLSVFNDVVPGASLPISPVAPPTIARQLGAVPRAIDVHVLLMRSRERTRDVAKAIEAARASPEGTKIVTTIATALATTNPATAGLVTLASELLGLVCRILSDAKDRQLFYAVASVEETDGLGIGTPIVLEDDGARVELEIRGLRP